MLEMTTTRAEYTSAHPNQYRLETPSAVLVERSDASQQAIHFPLMIWELVDSLWLGADSGFLSFGYQYCWWHFSQASSMPLPTSKILSLSFASIALNASIAASCKPWAYLIQAARSLLIMSSICSGASSTFGS